MIIILMGVAGSGKTTVGKLLARKLHWPFLDADEFHPASNIAKMSAGIPLTDRDRIPWLKRIRAKIGILASKKQSAIIACSALKSFYRKLLCGKNPDVKFIYLKGSFRLIHDRLALRKGHFMKPAMLRGQFEALEVSPDLIAVSVRQRPEEIVEQIRKKLEL